MNPVYDKLQKCLKCAREKVDFVPDVALVLGSGLGDYADTMKVEATLDYKDIEGFPVSTAPGHVGRFILAIPRLLSCREECISMKDMICLM